MRRRFRSLCCRFRVNPRSIAAAALWAAFLFLTPVSGFLTPATATISSSQSTVTLAGNGSQTVFLFPFVGVATADIQVIFTSAAGVQTTLTQGPGPTQYQVVLNPPPVSGSGLWGIGGTVTYNPSGTPIPSGSTLTISRVLPLTQSTSLQNQASFGQYASTTEQALDQAVMALQQVANSQGRAILGNIANSSPPNPLPPAAQVAGLGLCFDGTGNNVIGCSLAPSGTISSAMAPVVGAASLPAGRAALGLGTMAQEAINAGTCGGATIQDDGAGNARVVFATVADLTNQAVTCAFHGSQRQATGALVYTLPQASTLFNGFGFFVNALNSAVTITPNAADNFSGMASGASMVVAAGTQAYIATNASPSGTWFLTVQNTASLNAPLNLQLNASVASNALTIALKDRNGNDPSTASPVILSLSNGGNIAPRAITAPVSITVPAGATLGTSNGNGNRIWIAAFDNAGIQVLGVYNALAGLGGSITSIVPWDESSVASPAAISAGSTSAQTWYAASALTSRAFRILGYVESTQTTAGTWAAAPSKVQLFGPGVKKPGDVVQEITSVVTSGSTISGSTFAALSGQTVTISPQSPANLVRVEANGSLTGPAATGTGQTTTATVQLSTGTVANTGLLGAAVTNQMSLFGAGASQGGLVTPAYLAAYSFPNTTSATTFAVQGRASGGGGSGTYGGASQLIVKEIMGAPDLGSIRDRQHRGAPANDNGTLAMAG